MEKVVIDKLVHGGQGLGKLKNGKTIFVWNALPGETVSVRIIKNKKDYSEGIAEEVLISSEFRRNPKDEAYLSTSPWQIMDFAFENNQKFEILKETFNREKITVDNIIFHDFGEEWNYRNKMEYSFWADETGLNLSLHNRGSHRKIIVKGSSISNSVIDTTAKKIVDVLNESGIRGSQLKTIILRSNQVSEVVAALFVKDKNFPIISKLENICKGIEVCYSNPKSPASIKTELLYGFGDITLIDKILSKNIKYDVYSFFQVNVPVFDKVAGTIKNLLKDYNKVDLYCGVGAIGMAVDNTKYFVDIDENNYKYALQNVGVKGKVVNSSSEKALEYIDNEHAF